MNLKEYMENRGITNKELALSLGYSPTYVSYVLTGKRSPGKKFILQIYTLTRGAVVMDKNEKCNTYNREDKEQEKKWRRQLAF